MLWEGKTNHCSNNADVIQWEHRWWQWEWRGPAGGIKLVRTGSIWWAAGEVHVYNRQGWKTRGWLCVQFGPIFSSHEVDTKIWVCGLSGKTDLATSASFSQGNELPSPFVDGMCLLSSLPQFPFPSAGLGDERVMRNTGFRRGSWFEGYMTGLAFRHFQFEAIMKQPHESGFSSFVRKTVKHFHFPIIHFGDHPRQFRVPGWLSCNALPLGTSASCFLHTWARQYTVILILAQVKYNLESNSLEAKLSVVLPLPNIYIYIFFF